jgi:hypothetical protein
MKSFAATDFVEFVAKEYPCSLEAFLVLFRGVFVPDAAALRDFCRLTARVAGRD